MSIPILLLTGLSTKGAVERGLREGGNDYITKPYDYDELLKKVGALCKAYHVFNSKGVGRSYITTSSAFPSHMLYFPQQVAIVATRRGLT